MSLADRIKKIRMENNMKQSAFGEIFGVKEATVTSWETSSRKPSESVILAMCHRFNINEKWLRTGEGDQYKKLTKDQIITDFAADLIREDESFKTRLIAALAKLDETEWKVLEKVLENMTISSTEKKED